MPYVINMSFGSQLGPHDGSQPTDQAINNFLKEGKGFVCAAMGNEGDLAIHATHTFTSDGETKSVLVRRLTKTWVHIRRSWVSFGRRIPMERST